MLPKWNAPIGKAPESKNCLRNSCLPSPCPGGLHCTLEYYRLWGSLCHCYFMQIKLFLPLQSTFPYKSLSVFAVLILISMTLIILSLYTLQGESFNRQRLWSCSHCDQTTRTVERTNLFIRSFQVVGTQCHFLACIQVFPASPHALVPGRLFLWYQLNFKVQPMEQGVII